MINLYAVGNTTFTNNGDATLLPISCTVKIAINGAWQLNMELPYDKEDRYRLVSEGAVVKVPMPAVSEQSTANQLFRIYDYKRNLHSVSVIAFPVAMESTFDAPISQIIIDSDVTGASAASTLNGVSQKYAISSDVSNTGRTVWTNTNLNKAICGADENSFINVWGGEVCYDNYAIKIKEQLGDSTNEDKNVVMYGKNITAIAYEIDDSGLITRVYPLSEDGIRYNDDGTEYIDSDKIEDYPIVHANYMTTPYTLVEDDSTSISRTAAKTADIKSRISTLASTLSHSIWNTAVSNGWKIEYMVSIYKDIIANIQAMVTANYVHEDFIKVVNDAVASGMAWMAEQEDPEWTWISAGTDAWKYGNDTSQRYAHNEWQYIDKKWRYFGNDYYWQEPKDDNTDWAWYENQTTHKKWYGTQDRYYLKGQYIYITEDGTLTKYWLDGDGWYDSDKTDESEYDWHESSSAPGAWWFGDEDGDNYISGQWAFIDGTLYWFDDEGYYYGEKKEHPQLDWQQSGEAFWFGNPDHSYDSIWLTSQWAKIDRQWYKFDSSGYVEEIHDTCIALFHNGMSSLTTLVATCNSECYELLYDLMEEWTDKQFSDGIDTPTVTINVDMVDLSRTIEYKDYQNLEKIHLGDTVKCVDYVHAIATVERVVELTYDVLRGYNTAITIGVANSTVGSMLSGSTGGGSGSGYNSAINVEVIEQNIAQKNPTLRAGDNVHLTNNVDGTQTISSDKNPDLRAGTHITITPNQDGSQTISADGGALAYWVETEPTFYRRKSVNIDNAYGWDCDEAYKWVSHAGDGKLALVAYIRQGWGSTIAGFCNDSQGSADGQVCFGWAKVLNMWGNRHDYTLIAISAQANGFFHIWGSGNTPTYSFTYNGTTLYCSEASTGAETEDISDMMFAYPEFTIYGTTYETGMASVPYLGQFESIAEARTALIEQSHFSIRTVHYTGESIGDYSAWGGKIKTFDSPENIEPDDMPWNITDDGEYNGADYKIKGISIEEIYQKKLIEGNYIDIASDGKTISADLSDRIPTSAKGANNGVAELDANGKVPSAQLPSFVDDVIEGYYYNGNFYEDSAHQTIITGEAGKIYVDLATEKTYRWGGSAYVEISESLALGETSTTAYRGDRGKTAYDHATETRLTTATASGLFKVASTSEGHIAGLTAVQKSDITALGIPAQDTTYTAGTNMELSSGAFNCTLPFAIVNGELCQVYDDGL